VTAQGEVHLSSPLTLIAAPGGVVATWTSMPAGAATTSAALRLRAIFTRNAMPATATIRPSIAPKNNAFFQATGFCCGGGVRPLGGLKGGGPTGGVGGTACGPVDGKALVGKIGGGEN
jgi:hypothetical protein